MKHSVRRDLKIRKKFLQTETDYIKLKSLFENLYLNGEYREKARIYLEKKGGLLVKAKNRCVVTGRSRSILKKYKVSRITFKELASQGYFVGVKKRSW